MTSKVYRKHPYLVNFIRNVELVIENCSAEKSSIVAVRQGVVAVGFGVKPPLYRSHLVSKLFYAFCGDKTSIRNRGVWVSALGVN